MLICLFLFIIGWLIARKMGEGFDPKYYTMGFSSIFIDPWKGRFRKLEDMGLHNIRDYYNKKSEH